MVLNASVVNRAEWFPMKTPSRPFGYFPKITPSATEELAELLDGFAITSEEAYCFGKVVTAMRGDIRLPGRMLRQLDGRQIVGFVRHGELIVIVTKAVQQYDPKARGNETTQKLPRKYGRPLRPSSVFGIYRWRDEFVLVPKPA